MKPSCLDDTILQALAADIALAETTQEQLEHIAQCDRCYARLERYLAEFSNKITPDEQALLSTLESSAPEWQKAFVEKLLRFKDNPDPEN